MKYYKQLFCRIIVKYLPGGHSTFVGLLNTFVHVILYGYYFLAALGPQIQKYLWWKRYITKLQLVSSHTLIYHVTLSNNKNNFRFSSAWCLFTVFSCWYSIVNILNGQFLWRCPTPYSFTTCSVISIIKVTTRLGIRNQN